MHFCSKRLMVFFFISFFSCTSYSQPLPEFLMPISEPTSHIKFLASDELEGRMTGEHGNDVAARYIAAQFEKFGVKPLQNASGYFQRVPMLKRLVPTKVMVSLAENTLPSEDLLLLSGNASEFNASFVYVGFGIVDSLTGRDDYNSANVAGKLVVARVGMSEQDSPRELFSAFKRKQEIAKSKGAIGLIELYKFGFPFSRIKQFLGGGGISLDYSTQDAEMEMHSNSKEGESFVHLLVNDESLAWREWVNKKPKAKIQFKTDGYKEIPISSNNVVGFIEGSDVTLKNEYVLLSAHYDHIGIKSMPGAIDSIFNGARDNAMGTTAILCAAKAFSEVPPKRSILFLACTGEEVGLLGSEYYAEHPLVSLRQTVFNLNIDGAGYNDTSIVTVIGLERTTAQTEIIKGAKVMGLGVIQDPAPEQNLFDRSDNVSFAKKGIPAPTFSEGFTSFDEKIGKYYHQAADQADEQFDFNYLHRFVKSFIYSARLIADTPQAPRWKEGDKYESVGKLLYGK